MNKSTTPGRDINKNYTSSLSRNSMDFPTTRSTSTDNFKKRQNSISSKKLTKYNQGFIKNVDYPSIREISRKSSQCRLENIIPVFEVEGETDALDERKSLTNRISMISDGEDWLIQGSLRERRNRFNIKRSRSSDLRLPEVRESKEENYAELKKKIIFQHHLNPLVDKSESKIFGDRGILDYASDRQKLVQDLKLPEFNTIKEELNEDDENKKRRVDLFSASLSSRRSSRRSSVFDSPMSRSLKRVGIDHMPVLEFDDKKRITNMNTHDKIDERSREDEEDEEDSQGSMFKSSIVFDERQKRTENLKKIIEGEIISQSDKTLLETISGRRSVRSAIFMGGKEIIEEKVNQE